MRKPLFCVSAAALTLAVSGGIAPAHTGSYPNGVVFNPVATSPTTIQYNGRVFGPRFCRARREVDILVGGSHFKTEMTDRGGFFSVGGPLPPRGTAATAVAKLKVKKTRRHRHKCAAKAETKTAR